jgi:N4-(beta-N-acetylglucosaminyl)-L-asparaginase
MRRGRSPKDAGMEALRRIKANTIEKRLLNKEGNPAFGINFYVLDRRGQHAGVTMYEGAKYAVCDAGGPRTLDCEPLLPKPAA